MFAAKRQRDLSPSRNPNPTELKALTDLYQQCQREQASELDSMTAVASVLLNLDEIMSK